MTKAVTLAELADQNVLTATDNKVGIATTNPQSTLQVGTGITMNGNTGVITAQAYYGDGSNLTGVDSTALKDTNDSVRVQATTTGATITGDLTVDNISVGGTLTYDDVTNVDSIGIVTARSGIVVVSGGATITGVSTFYSAVKVGTAITIDSASGVITATKFSGDGSGLIGVASTDNIITGTAATFNNVVKVGTGITMDATSGIITATAFHGDGSNLTFAPKIIAFDPAALSTGVAADTNITITFDQDIQFAGAGTYNITLRSTSASGSEIETFVIQNGSAVGGNSSGINISGTQLIINPTNNLSDNTVVYVIIPNLVIEATSGGSYYAGSNNYNFRTAQQTFSVQGGDSVWTTTDSNSPTGYYRYHVFEDENNIGVATFSADTTQATDMFVLMVAGGGAGGRAGAMPGSPRNYGGGGGAGGVRTFTGPTLNLPAGTYNVGVGSGGNAMPGPIENGPQSAFNAALPQINGTPSRIYNGQVTVQSVGGGGGATGLTPNDNINDHIVQSGGSGGGGFGLWDPQSTPGSLTVPGASGVSGQGYPGGIGKNFTAATGSASYDVGVSGGGGGAGGAGGDGTRITSSPDNSQVGGAGGPGVAVPQFSNSILLGNTNIPIPSVSRIGPTGLYGGGGGGVGGSGPGAGAAGKGGPGGGGDGFPFQATVNVYPDNNYTDPGNGQSGVEFTGGGGGAGNNLNGTGGQGVIMIRYAVNL